MAKVAIVTGAGRGIGAATAKLLAKNGYAVCINYLHDQHSAQLVADDIRQQGGRSIIVKADISVEDEVEELFSTVDVELGELHLLVNNAGILRQQSRVEQMSAKRINRVLQVNVTGTLLCCKQAVNRMSTRHGGHGGVIINVSSVAARTGSPNEYIDYAASKGAVDSLTRGLATEVAAEGIRVNAVRPGLIHTDIHADGGEPERVDRLKTKIPMQRGGEPLEVAKAIVWLASDEASYITGSFIDLAGGL